MIGPFEGRARRLGDAVNTDYIVASARKRETLDPHELKRWLLEALDPGFAASVQEGDILVAGERFGTGSAMEVAVTVVLAAGIPCVLAKSFSRTYFRNALNNGLVPLECDTDGIEEGHRLRVRVSDEETFVVNGTTGTEMRVSTLPPFALRLLEAGGLVPYLRLHGDFAGTP